MEVEVRDVNAAEARALLLSLDPLAALAGVQEPLRDRLLALAPPVPPELEAAWQAAARAALVEEPDRPRRGGDELPEQFYVLITCRDEKQQVALLERFLGEGLACKAVLS